VNRPLALLRGVEVFGENGALISTSSYEYGLTLLPDGREVTSRLTTILDGDRTVTTYQTACGLPIKIERSGEVTQFEYDAACHVTRKDTPSEVSLLAYDPKVGKVTRVERWSKSAPEKKTRHEFAYDAAGNLVRAESHDGKKVSLKYDANGRISEMTDLTNNRVVSFVYNQSSKPIEITVSGVGAITVQYNERDEIKKVESSGGREVSLQVTSAFQHLLDIIRPAGVSLSF
jgi:YD repeat-containing protein